MRQGVSVFALVFAILASACASTGAVPKPFPVPGTPPAPPPASATRAAPIGADGYSVAGTALSLRGAPYRNGGSDPSGFDCSGLVWYVLAQHGIRISRTVTDQFRAGRHVDPQAIEPGDLVFFTTTAPGPSHVGVVIGGDEFVHAPASSGLVRVDRLSTPYWGTRFLGARRVL